MIFATHKSQKVLVYGVFKAMGDLLSAVAVIRKQLDLGYEVHLLVFPSSALKAFIDLLDFGENKNSLAIHEVPSSGHFLFFMNAMRKLHPDGVWISPHSPAEAASKKIPVMLRAVRDLFWRGATIAGADTEPYHRLFNVRVSLNRNLPLAQREWAAFRLWRSEEMPEQCEQPRFLPSIMQLRNQPAVYDLLIHPGANAKNRSWPAEHFVETVKLLPNLGSIAILGLPQEVETLRSLMPSDRQIEFLTGSLKLALSTIARSRVMLSMDSGNVHFAKVLRVPTVAVFGKSDPANIIGDDDIVRPVYERKFDCQPCGLAECFQSEVYCMNAVMPSTVAAHLSLLLQQTSKHRLIQLTSSDA